MSSIATENQMIAVEIDESINKLNLLFNDVAKPVQISHRNLIKYAHPVIKHSRSNETIRQRKTCEK
jgi:hypothetical protein